MGAACTWSTNVLFFTVFWCFYVISCMYWGIACSSREVVVVVVVEITLVTSILNGALWTVAYSEF